MLWGSFTLKCEEFFSFFLNCELKKFLMKMVFEMGFDDMEMWSKVSFQIASEGKSLMKMAFGVGLIDMKM